MSTGQESSKSAGGGETRVSAVSARLQRLVFDTTSRALFKEHLLTFAMHLVHETKAKLFKENVRCTV